MFMKYAFITIIKFITSYILYYNLYKCRTVVTTLFLMRMKPSHQNEHCNHSTILYAVYIRYLAEYCLAFGASDLGLKMPRVVLKICVVFAILFN